MPAQHPDFTHILADHELMARLLPRLMQRVSTFEPTSLLEQEVTSDPETLFRNYIQSEETERRRIFYEIIVSLTRPSILVQDGTFSIDANDIEDVLKERLIESMPLLRKAIASCGQICLSNDNDLDAVGSGWLASPRLIVTTFSVVNKFAEVNEDNQIVIKKNAQGQTLAAFINFRKEYNRSTQIKIPIRKVLFLDNYNHSALLEIDHSEAQSQNIFPLIIDDQTRICAGDYVASIGYPGEDTRLDPEWNKTIFDGIYDVKRISPGQIRTVESSYLVHDCSTTTWGSGSPIVNLKSGKVVGMHFSGDNQRKLNHAVPGWTLKKLIQSH